MPDMILQSVKWVLATAMFVLYMKSSLLKLGNPLAFRETLRQYALLPHTWLDWFAPGLAVLELLAAVWVLVPWTRLSGAVLGAGLQGIFLVAIFLRLGVRLPRGCGCFRLNFPEVVSRGHLATNACLLATFALLAVLE